MNVKTDQLVEIIGRVVHGIVDVVPSTRDLTVPAHLAHDSGLPIDDRIDRPAYSSGPRVFQRSA